MNTFLRIAWILPTLALLGFGCAKKDTATQPPDPQTDFQLNAWLPPEATKENEQKRNLRELREALTAFQSAKSFRADLSIDVENGSTVGKITVVKPDRFHGTITVAGEKEASEVIAVGETVYVKMPENIWIPLRSKTLAGTLRNAFRASIDGENDLLREQLPDDTVVTKTPNSSKGCENYSVSISHSGVNGTLSVCVTKGLPLFIEVVTDAGTFHIDYSEYNGLYTIERPTIPKEFQTPLPK